jgi:DNA-binding SARP family transcriptional activator/tetratricopeptide (TPR) repeat protein
MGTSEIHDALRLHALGGLSITANGATLTGTVARRRSLALLALVASAGESGVSDEHALSLLWPDFDTPRARNNLKQVAFTLRQALGRDAFLRTTTNLRLDPALFTVDRWDFEKAIASRDVERAIVLYTGPFLAGFHLTGLSEFSNWVEGERERLANLYTGALTSVASGAEAAGNYAEAIEWWRKAMLEDRLNDTTAQRLIRALALSGDTVGALQHARVHAELLKQDDLQPSPAFERLVEDIKNGGTLHTMTPRSNVRVDTPASVPAILIATTGRTEPAKADATRTRASRMEPTTRETPLRAPRSRRIWTTGERRVAGFTTRLTSSVVILIVIAAIAAITVARYGPSWGNVDDAESSAVIVPFAGNGADNVGTVVSELLAASLDGSLGLRTVAVGGAEKSDSGVAVTSETRRASARRAAAKLGAGYYIFGEVFEIGDKVRLTAEFRSRADDTVLDRAVVEGTKAELFDLVDRVASQLLAGRVSGGRRDVVRLASTTTSSLPAAKAYYRAEAALGEGSFRAAIDAYEEAIQIDPSFALAHYGMATAANMLGDDRLVIIAAAQALQFAQRLPSRQKRLLSAFVARHQGDVALARRMYAQLTTDYPEDAEAWSGLGETLFHLNPLDGRPSTDAREAFERALQIDSASTSAYVHLARIAALEGDAPHSQRMVAHARALAPERAVARFALHVLALGVPDDAARDTPNGRRAARDLPTAAIVGLLSHNDSDDLRRFAQRLVGGDVRGYGLRLQSMIELGQGKIREALALLDTCYAANHSLAIEARSRLAALSFIPVDRQEIDKIRNELTTWNGEAHPLEAPLDSAVHGSAHPHLKLHRLGLIALRLNDTAAAAGIANQLDDIAKKEPTAETAKMLAASLRAHIAAARGRTREALLLLEGISGARVASVTSLEAYDRLLRAQLLEQSGRDEEALGFYSQIGARSPFELTLTWQAELGMARIHEKRGNPAVAARYYRSVAARLRNADAALQQARQNAEERAVALLPLDRRGWF